MKHRIRISSRAWREIDHASLWWRRHRDKAPDAFDEDIDEALALIRTNPSIAPLVRARRIGVRALWLERIGYFVYYRLVNENTVEILALWHASRRSQPRL